MPKPAKSIDSLLTNAFKPKHIHSALAHFDKMVDDYQKRDWEDAAAKGGKFIEAVLKAHWDHVGEAVPTGKHFKAGTIIDKLQGKAAFSDTIRLTIPRACRFAYEIASNRGARHDADEIDANEMDASTVLSVCAWILSEMIRFSQKGLDLAEARRIVEGIMHRRYPFVEEIDGRVYVDIGESAKEKALLILWYVYPGRMKRVDLINLLIRHEFSSTNANVAATRISGYVDDDGHGNLRLRNRGLKEAEELIAQASAD